MISINSWAISGTYDAKLTLIVGNDKLGLTEREYFFQIELLEQETKNSLTEPDESTQVQVEEPEIEEPENEEGRPSFKIEEMSIISEILIYFDQKMLVP